MHWVNEAFIEQLGPIAEQYFGDNFVLEILVQSIKGILVASIQIIVSATC